MVIIKFNQKGETVVLEDEIIDLCHRFNSEMMDEYELSYLAACIRNSKWRQDTYILEIGTYTGKTSVFMAKVLIFLNLKIIIAGIDPFEFAIDEPQNAKGIYSKYIESIISNGVMDICFPVVTFSEKGYNIFNAKVGVLVVDGCHTYDCVKKDLELYSKLVLTGGYIFVDDYSDGYPEVKRAFDEWIRKTREFEIVHRENWFVIVRKMSNK